MNPNYVTPLHCFEKRTCEKKEGPKNGDDAVTLIAHLLSG